MPRRAALGVEALRLLQRSVARCSLACRARELGSDLEGGGSPEVAARLADQSLYLGERRLRLAPTSLVAQGDHGLGEPGPDPVAEVVCAFSPAQSLLHRLPGGGDITEAQPGTDEVVEGCHLCIHQHPLVPADREATL